MMNACSSKLLLLLLLIFFSCLATVSAQTNSGVLYRGEVWVQNKLYPPRFTTTEIAAIPSPIQGLLVYDTTLDQLKTYDGSAWIGTGGSFIILSDTPATYGTAGQTLVVNSGTDALIWADANNHIHTFLSLSDSPSAFASGDALKLVRVNSAYNALEFVEMSGSNITTGTVPVARLPLMVGATTLLNGTAGLVIQPLVANRLQFLRGDGTWATPELGTISIADLSEFNSLSPSGANQIAVSADTDELVWTNISNIGILGSQITSTISRNYLQVMQGATSSVNGISGAVPAPTTGDIKKVLTGAGVWDEVPVPEMVGATAYATGEGGGVPIPEIGDQVKFLTGGAIWDYVPFSSVSDLPDAWTAGTDDTDAGSYTAYGDDDATGGSITLYNAASEDDSIDFWLVEADGDFVIKADTAPVFTISPTLEQFAVAAGSYTVTYAHGVTDNRTYTLPDQTGIVAITDPGSAGLVENNGDGTYTVREIVTDTITNDTTTIPTSNAVYDYIDGLELGGGGMTSFTLAGSTGSNQTITNGNTLTIAAGGGIETVGGATDTVTVQLSATLFATAGLMYTNGAGTYSVASVENTTINNGSTNIPTENAVYDYIAGLPTGLPSGDAVLEVIDRFTPSEAEYPTSAYATLSFRNNRPIILFPDGAAASSIMFTGWVPSNYDPSTDGLEVEVWYSPSTAESQSFRVEAAVERIVTGGSALDLGTDSFDTGVAITTTAHSGHDDMYVETIPLTSGDVDALAGGEMYRLLIKRDPTHGDDGATATMQVHQVLVKVVSE